MVSAFIYPPSPGFSLKYTWVKSSGVPVHTGKHNKMEETFTKHPRNSNELGSICSTINASEMFGAERNWRSSRYHMTTSS